jgi:hypothetical protein
MDCPLCGQSFPNVASLERHVNQCLDQKETRHDEDYALALMQAEDENRVSSLPMHSNPSYAASQHYHLQQKSLQKHGYASEAQHAAVRSAALASRRQASRDTLKNLNHRLNLLRQTRDAFVALRVEEVDRQLDSTLLDIYSVAIKEYMGVLPNVGALGHQDASSGPSIGAAKTRRNSESASRSPVSSVTQVEASIIDKAVRSNARF